MWKGSGGFLGSMEFSALFNFGSLFCLSCTVEHTQKMHFLSLGSLPYCLAYDGHLFAAVSETVPFSEVVIVTLNWT